MSYDYLDDDPDFKKILFQGKIKDLKMKKMGYLICIYCRKYFKPKYVNQKFCSFKCEKKQEKVEKNREKLEKINQKTKTRF